MKMLLVGILASGLSAQVATQANSDAQKPRELTREMGLAPGMTVADIGTGIGYMLPFLSRRVGPTGHVIAEDTSDDFLAAAKQRVQNQNLENVTFVKGTETDPGLPEAHVDVALAFEAYHHFTDPEKVLAAINKALRPGGKLVVVEHYKSASTRIRLDMPDLIKEIEANHFHLIEEKEHVKDEQYMLILEKR